MIASLMRIVQKKHKHKMQLGLHVWQNEAIHSGADLMEKRLTAAASQVLRGKQ